MFFYMLNSPMLRLEFDGASRRDPYIAMMGTLATVSTLLLTSCGGNQSAASPVVATMGLTTTQQISLSATTTDPAGVKWSISPSGGSFSPASSLSGANVKFTAPSAAGVYSVAATNVTDGSIAKSVTIGVTDLAGVYTYHNDLGRTGADVKEYALTPANVNGTSFGKLFSCTADGAIYAQPLWVANVTVGGTKHNVVFVATAHDGLFAFDADVAPCVTLWSASLIDSAHGAAGTETTVVSGGPGALVGVGNGDITPETGVIGTPVIDPSTSTLYVVSKSMDSTGANFYQRLHAIDLATGQERTGSPITIAAIFPGTGDGGSTVSFNAKQELERAALAFVNGVVYIAWAGHEDAPPYYGLLVGYSYNGSSFTQKYVLNVAPNDGDGGIWMSGSAPAVDAAGNLYVLTGNGEFDANNLGPVPNTDYGDSLLMLSSSLGVLQYFTPSDQALDASSDLDFGAGGAAVLADLPASSPVQHLVVGGAKDGSLYVANRDALGGYGNPAWQEISVGGAVLSTPALWNGYLYIAPGGGQFLEYYLDPSTAQFNLSDSGTLPSVYRGLTLSVSASQNTNGIVWVVDSSQAAGRGSSVYGPAVLDAFDATNLKTPLWTSATNAADGAGNAVKFVMPTIANGKVYMGTRGNNAGGAYGSTTISGELDVYGLK
jgi:hypothetical protein